MLPHVMHNLHTKLSDPCEDCIFPQSLGRNIFSSCRHVLATASTTSPAPTSPFLQACSSTFSAKASEERIGAR